jgi:hypothetical protein
MASSMEEQKMCADGKLSNMHPSFCMEASTLSPLAERAAEKTKQIRRNGG